MALVNYGRKVTTMFNLNQHNSKAKVLSAITKSISPRQRIAKVDGGKALSTVRTQVFSAAKGDRPGVPNGVILITDTRTNIKPAGFIAEANKLKAAGTQIFTIGLGKANQRELGSAASQPAASYSTYVPKYGNLGPDVKKTVGAVVNACK